MNQPTNEQITKLPRWAREHIENLTRRALQAEATTKRLAADQPVSSIYVDDWLSTPRIRRYVNHQHCPLVIEHAGVLASVHLARKDDGQRLYGIEITYGSVKPSLSFNPIAIMPRGIQCIQLVHKDEL